MNKEDSGKKPEHFPQNREEVRADIERWEGYHWCQKLELPVYEFSHELMKPDPEGIRPRREFQLPRDLKFQRWAVRLFSHYSKWIPHFSDKAHLLVRNSSFSLQDNVQTFFMVLSNHLEGAVVTTVDQELPLVASSDALDMAVSTTLSQNCLPSAVFSRTLSNALTNQPITQSQKSIILPV